MEPGKYGCLVTSLVQIRDTLNTFELSAEPTEGCRDTGPWTFICIAALMSQQYPLEAKKGNGVRVGVSEICCLRRDPNKVITQLPFWSKGETEVSWLLQV